MHFLRINRTGEWILVALDFLQHTIDLFQRRVGKSGAGLANVDQPLPVVIKPEHERSEKLAGAFWVGVAADYAVNSPSDFYLQPFGGAALLIATVSFLGENAFQPLLFRDFEQGGSLFTGIVIGIAHDVAGIEN